MARSKFVIATVPVVGYHAWEGATDTHEHLRYLHRHVFTFKVWVRVHESDREIEYHVLQQIITNVLHAGWAYHGSLVGLMFRGNSCEHLAEWLMDKLHEQSIAVRAVEVWEDEENGSRVEAYD